MRTPTTHKRLRPTSEGLLPDNSSDFWMKLRLISKKLFNLSLVMQISNTKSLKSTRRSNKPYKRRRRLSVSYSNSLTTMSQLPPSVTTVIQLIPLSFWRSKWETKSLKEWSSNYSRIWCLRQLRISGLYVPVRKEKANKENHFISRAVLSID